MPFQVLWFVVAGFVLGFTTSTLWEWLYYRRIRLRRLGAHRQMHGGVHHPDTPGLRAGPHNVPDGDRDVPGHSVPEGAEWQLPAYRSLGVFLENERPLPLPQTPEETQVTDEKRHVYPSGTTVYASPGTAADMHTPGQSPVTDRNVDSSSGQVGASAHSKMNGDLGRIAHSSARERPFATGSQQATEPHATRSTGSTGEVPNGTDHSAVTRVTLAKVPAVSSSPAPAPDSTPVLPSGDLSRAVQRQPAERLPTQSPPTQSPPTQGQITQTGRATDHPDNLANIKGIGEAYKRRLYATGIYTWRQLAESDTESLRRITRAKPNADIYSWQIQAREMAEKQNRWHANFTGPLDDFTRIEGIGAITADILYKVGICTYEQLAATTVDELERVVPAPTVGDENDFEGWIRSATYLASAKQRNGGRLP